MMSATGLSSKSGDIKSKLGRDRRATNLSIGMQVSKGNRTGGFPNDKEIEDF